MKRIDVYALARFFILVALLVGIIYAGSKIDEGFKLEWDPVEKIQEVLSQDKPSNYEGSKFICKRDSAIIVCYNDWISNLTSN